MKRAVTLEEALDVVKQLSPVDKARLIEQIVPDIERELVASPRALPTARKSLWGVCADLGPAPSSEDIVQARREEWANFPREDI